MLLNDQKTFTRFENQYILMLAVRAKQDLMLALKEEEEKIKFYGETEAQSFIDPNLRDYVEALTSIIEKARTNMNKYDAWETGGK